MTLRLRIVHRQVILVAIILVVVLAAAVPTALAQTASPTALEPGACPAPNEPLASGAVVVQGWVINHRELTVDGTRTASALQINAVSSTGTTVSAPVASNGYFKLTLIPDVWNFSLQLPADWDGIVPVAPRGGLAVTGCTPLAGQQTPYLIVFKIRRLFDVTAQKWEEMAGGAVQPGPGWKITFQPINDPFAVVQTRTTAADGTAIFTVTPGTWLAYEWYRSGWTPLTPAQVTLHFDPYAASGAPNLVVFKNRRR
jgi:hypothetical protein